MQHRCVVANFLNVNDPVNEISLHRIPFWNEWPQAKKRRRQWFAFVLRILHQTTLYKSLHV